LKSIKNILKYLRTTETSVQLPCSSVKKRWS